MAEKDVKIKEAVAILQTLPEWWKRRVSGKAKEYIVERDVMERLKQARLVEMCSGEYNEYRQTRRGAELIEMYTNIYYHGGDGFPLSCNDLQEWEDWYNKEPGKE